MADYIGDLRKIIGTRSLIMCGANVILINDKEEILLHHRVDRDWWGLPGGAMELYYKYPDGNEVFNVTATYICTDYSGKIVIDLTEGRDAKFFSLKEIPLNLSSPIKGIIEEFVLKYDELKNNGLV